MVVFLFYVTTLQPVLESAIVTNAEIIRCGAYRLHEYVLFVIPRSVLNALGWLKKLTFEEKIDAFKVYFCCSKYSLIVIALTY